MNDGRSSSSSNSGPGPDRRFFDLGLLRDASHELSGLSTPQQIAKAFLLTAMGGLGAMSGFILVANGPDREGHADPSQPLVLHRGLTPEEAARLTDGAGPARMDFLACGPDGRPPRQPHLIAAANLAEDSPFPGNSRLLVRWTLEGGCCGILGLGPRLGWQPDSQAGARPESGEYGPDDSSLLLNLVDCLLTALSRAQLTQRLAAMGQDLRARNAELDRRVFQQDTLIQALSEMNTQTDSDRLLESFLLFLMGTAGSGHGYVMLLDAAGELVRFRGKGVNEGQMRALDPVRLRQVATRGLFSGGGRRVGWLEDPAQLAEVGLPPGYCGIWFLADENSYGFAGLGARLDSAPLDEAQRETLLAVAGAFLTCLRTVRLLEATRALNRQLEARNLELQQTLDQITGYRIEIDGLERAKARIKELVLREMNRVSQVSRADFAILLVVSMAMGFLFNWANPSGVELVPSHWSRPATPATSPQQAKGMLDAGQAILVDARPQESFKQGHIPGAVNLTPDLFDFLYGMRLSKQPKDKPILIYGRTVSRLYDEDVAGLLARRGHKNVMLLSGGLAAWKDAGFAVKP